jgi:hypothetical protein
VRMDCGGVIEWMNKAEGRRFRGSGM